MPRCSVPSRQRPHTSTAMRCGHLRRWTTSRVWYRRLDAAQLAKIRRSTKAGRTAFEKALAQYGGLSWWRDPGRRAVEGQRLMLGRPSIGNNHFSFRQLWDMKGSFDAAAADRASMRQYAGSVDGPSPAVTLDRETESRLPGTRVRVTRLIRRSATSGCGTPIRPSATTSRGSRRGKAGPSSASVLRVNAARPRTSA